MQDCIGRGIAVQEDTDQAIPVPAEHQAGLTQSVQRKFAGFVAGAVIGVQQYPVTVVVHVQR